MAYSDILKSLKPKAETKKIIGLTLPGLLGLSAVLATQLPVFGTPVKMYSPSGVYRCGAHLTPNYTDVLAHCFSQKDVNYLLSKGSVIVSPKISTPGNEASEDYVIRVPLGVSEFLRYKTHTNRQIYPSQSVEEPICNLDIKKPSVFINQNGRVVSLDKSSRGDSGSTILCNGKSNTFAGFVQGAVYDGDERIATVVFFKNGIDYTPYLIK